MRFRSPFHLPGSTQTAQQSPASIHRTVDLKLFEHPEIQIRVSDRAVPAQDIRWLLRFFERRVAEGERFHAGETVQVGWMLTKLEAAPDDGFLCLTEPDMKVIPIRFIDSVDNTLKQLRNQKDVVESIAPARQPDFPSLRQSAVVCVEYKSAKHLRLRRNPAHEADSGWSLSDPGDELDSQNPSHNVRISLYQLAIDRPELIKFFALPPGLQVFLDNQQIRIVGPEGEIQPVPGSYLEALRQRRIQALGE